MQEQQQQQASGVRRQVPVSKQHWCRSSCAERGCCLRLCEQHQDLPMGGWVMATGWEVLEKATKESSRGSSSMAGVRCTATC
jgi:hypothetical protein